MIVAFWGGSDHGTETALILRKETNAA